MVRKKEIELFNAITNINYFLGKALVQLGKANYVSCEKYLKRYQELVSEADKLYTWGDMPLFVQEKLANRFPEEHREVVYNILGLGNLADFGTEGLNYAIFDFSLKHFIESSEKVRNQVLKLERQENAN